MSNLVPNPNIAVIEDRHTYASLIRADLQKSVEGIIAAGRHLQEAKDKLALPND
jgi:hypothetical protein